MNPTIVNPVLNRLQEIMIPNWVVARLRGRPSDEQNPSFPIDMAGELGVLCKPALSLVVPVGDFGSESVGDVGVDLGLGGLVGVRRFVRYFRKKE
jgi:hypothetical protein